MNLVRDPANLNNVIVHQHDYQVYQAAPMSCFKPVECCCSLCKKCFLTLGCYFINISNSIVSVAILCWSSTPSIPTQPDNDFSCYFRFRSPSLWEFLCYEFGLLVQFVLVQIICSCQYYQYSWYCTQNLTSQSEKVN